MKLISNLNDSSLSLLIAATVLGSALMANHLVQLGEQERARSRDPRVIAGELQRALDQGGQEGVLPTPQSLVEILGRRGISARLSPGGLCFNSVSFVELGANPRMTRAADLNEPVVATGPVIAVDPRCAGFGF